MRDIDIRYVSIYEVTQQLMSSFDAIIVHYAVRFAFPETLPKHFIHILENYHGLKFIFIQDEYDNTESVRRIFDRIAPTVVFTCVPEQNIELIYPSDRFSSTYFKNVLTGFAPEESLIHFLPIKDRKIDIGYRGRLIGNRYGKLGYEKWWIGEKTLSYKSLYPDLVMDISSLEEDRIYGEDWNHFLGNCKAVLVSESGSNVFDYDGKLRELDSAHKNLPYKIFERNFLAGLEIEGLMNQLSPRVFEAAATKTLMICFPGPYNDILKPWKNYLPLERDFSNFSEIVKIMGDDAQVELIVENTYNDLIASKKYGKEGYFNEIKNVIDEKLSESNYIPTIYVPPQKSLNESGPHLIVAKGVEAYSFPGRSIIQRIWKQLPFNFRILLLRRVNLMLYRLRRSRRK